MGRCCVESARSMLEAGFRPREESPFRQDLDELLLSVSERFSVPGSPRSKASGTGTRDTGMGPKPNNLCIERRALEKAGVRTPTLVRGLRRWLSMVSWGEREGQCMGAFSIGVASASRSRWGTPLLEASSLIVHLRNGGRRLRRMKGKLDMRRERRPLLYRRYRAKERQRMRPTRMGVKI